MHLSTAIRAQNVIQEYGGALAPPHCFVGSHLQMDQPVLHRHSHCFCAVASA
jgi:hypothetical protein